MKLRINLTCVFYTTQFFFILSKHTYANTVNEVDSSFYKVPYDYLVFQQLVGECPIKNAFLQKVILIITLLVVREPIDLIPRLALKPI